MIHRAVSPQPKHNPMTRFFLPACRIHPTHNFINFLAGIIPQAAKPQLQFVENFAKLSQFLGVITEFFLTKTKVSKKYLMTTNLA
jgi:hypothetical protein